MPCRDESGNGEERRRASTRLYARQTVIHCTEHLYTWDFQQREHDRSMVHERFQVEVCILGQAFAL